MPVPPQAPEEEIPRDPAWLAGESERLRLAYERAAQLSELRNRQILDSAVDYAIIAFDIDGKVLRWNEGAHRILGWTEAEMLGQDGECFFTPEDRAAGRLRSEMRQALIKGAGNDERWHMRKSGERFWANGELTPIRDDNGDGSGQAIGFVKVLRDRTEQHQAAQALQESANQFRTLAQAIPNHVWTAPPDGLLDWFNDRVYDYSGTTPGALDGQAWTRIVHPDDLQDAAERWAAALASGENYETEFRVRRADGAYRWHLVRALPVRTADGSISRWVGTNTDIHERKLAETQNLRDRNRIWALSQELMLVCDVNGVIAAVNPSAERLLGWKEEAMVGASLDTFIHPEDQDKTAAEIAKLADGATTLAFENRYRAKDGSYRLLAWTAVPDGGYIHGVARDVTEHRATEAALRQSQKMEAVGQLTGGIAHDFNNLLQGITGSLDLVQKRISQGRVGEVERFIQGAVTSAKRAAALTHRLLAFSRRQPLDPRPVQLNPLVASMEDLLHRTLGERIHLRMALAEDLWLTKSDANQVESAILNLAINSRDAMPEGGTLMIETRNVSFEASPRQQDIAPGSYVCISVSDTGVGMTADVQAKAFDPFFTTKPIGQGTGLGLSMIYGFARQSEGHARIYSEPGIGTTFKLYLPRHRGEDGRGDAPAAAASPSNAARAGETVLVIEDEPVVRALIIEVLNELGYQSLEAADGNSGLDILQAERPIDLLITDIGLPGMNGRQIAEAARALRPALKVLFMTGYAENAAFASGFLEPGMAMMTKPFGMEALATRIREIIEAAPGRLPLRGRTT